MNASRRSKRTLVANFEASSRIIIAAFALATPLAFAQTAGAQTAKAPTDMKAMSPEMMAAFERADANKDGKLDRKEAEAMPEIAQRFEMLDTNKDGALSIEEFAKAAGG
jgi:Ca2+-binding EF-hand superfamily protein